MALRGSIELTTTRLLTSSGVTTPSASTGRVVPGRAVTIDQRNHAGHVAETVCPNVLSGSHKQHARHAPRRGCIDALDMSVRHGRAQHEGMRHSR
jgi:hypothetical protein